MAKIDGGPAFPAPMSDQTTGNQSGAPFQPGMTLRDWFAGQAMAIYAKRWKDVSAAYRHNVAARCYAVADAMLAAREATND